MTLLLKKYLNLKIIGIILGTILALSFITNILGFTQISQTDARRLYKEAKIYQNNGDFKSAYNTYSQITHNYPASDIVLFQEAKCLATLGDEKNAIWKLETLTSNYKKSPVNAIASYNLAQAYLRIRKYNKAEAQFTYTSRNFSDTDYAIGSYYYLGSLYKKTDIKKAVSYWLRYLQSSPDGRFALDSLDGVLPYANLMTQEGKLITGIALYKNQRYKSALKLLKDLPADKNWYYLAKTQLLLGNTDEAISLLKSGIKFYPMSFAKAEMEDAMSSIVKHSNKSQLDSWSELVTIATQEKDFALFHKAELLPDITALPLYQKIATDYPTGDYCSEALWKIFQSEYKNENYSATIEIGKNHINKFTNKKASPKILFWIGKAFEKTDDTSQARNYYRKLISQYPDSYYAFRASERLNEINGGIDQGWGYDRSDKIVNTDIKPVFPYSYQELKGKYSIQAAELAENKDYETLLSITKNDPFIDSWVKLKEGMITRSIVLARDGMAELMPKPNYSDKKWRLVYPLYFTDPINQNGQLYQIDPFIIISLIKEESHFNPFAVSGSNAIGLMQLLPGTANDVARWNHLPAVGRLDLFNPEKNIQFGAAYFNHSRQSLDNSNLFAVAGYNSGPGAVKTWRNKSLTEDMDEFVEDIPYNQTRDYVKKVFGAYWNYKKIYNSN